MLTPVLNIYRKQLKVADLKEILTKAQVTIQGKANKADLIAKILASQEALNAYEELHGEHKQVSNSAATEQQPAQQQTVRRSASLSLLLQSLIHHA